MFPYAKELLEEIGGFNDEDFKIAYNDIDYCMRARKHGYRVIWTPFAELVHHESASRGSDETPANRERFERKRPTSIVTTARSVLRILPATLGTQPTGHIRPFVFVLSFLQLAAMP